ncbi:hypothetical protein GCM10020367_38810 [Streptomyces sannanensis]|uniref:Uncharacterized protein n=1 Tax=Streptomyces sannanensis TaxID=285536 RepID=A0ABP6SED1_9ACTN
MLRHEFRPGRLVAGLTLLTTAVAFAGDAAGDWHTPWYAAIPLITMGLFLAALVSGIDYGVRRRRRSARNASTDRTAAPASTNGDQAIR